MDDYKNLIIRYLTNELEAGDTDRLLAWINENPDNKLLAQSITETWLATAGKQEFHHPDILWEKLQPQINTGKKRQIHQFNYIRIAASWIIFFMLGSALTLWITNTKKRDSSKTSEITSPLGARSLIKLPDGTSVWLNAGSKIVYDEHFDKKERCVTLTGEAFFSVTTNKAKPFFVRTTDLIVRATGTKFNVKAYPEEKTITTTLEEGKIDVRLLTDKNADNKITLKPKEKIVFYKNGFEKNVVSENTQKNVIPNPTTIKPMQLEICSHINTELYTSWKENTWIIEGIPLSTLAPLLERRYNVKLVFENEDLKKYKFTGTIKNETIEQIMNLLRLTAPVDYTFNHEIIRLKLNKTSLQRFTTLTSKK